MTGNPHKSARGISKRIWRCVALDNDDLFEGLDKMPISRTRYAMIVLDSIERNPGPNTRQIATAFKFSITQPNTVGKARKLTVARQNVHLD